MNRLCGLIVLFILLEIGDAQRSKPKAVPVPANIAARIGVEEEEPVEELKISPRQADGDAVVNDENSCTAITDEEGICGDLRDCAWPWAAALAFPPNNDYLCGGTLIGDGWILTAAHCIHSSKAVHIRLGDHDLTVEGEITHRDYPVVETIEHENYNTKSFDNDIALLRFDNSQGYPDNVFPVCLPDDLVGESLDDKTPFVIGWGTIGFREASSNVLREVQIPVVENESCKFKFRHFSNVNITEKKLCAGEEKGGKDACQGDSGGGLFLPRSGGAWPWAAALAFPPNNDYLCGGTLIGDGWILTAAHCIHAIKPIYVRLGDHDLTIEGEITHRDYPVVEMIEHEHYNTQSFDDDIALVRFDNSQGYPDNVFPVCLPDDLVGRSLDNSTPFVIGWGTIGFRGAESNVLREVQIPIVDNASCGDKYRSFTNVRITEKKLCAGEEKGGKDACQSSDDHEHTFRVTPAVVFSYLALVAYGMSSVSFLMDFAVVSLVFQEFILASRSTWTGFVDTPIVFIQFDKGFAQEKATNHCRAVTNEDGICDDLRQCPPFHRLLSKVTASGLAFLKRSICRYEGNRPYVCCPLPIVRQQQQPLTTSESPEQVMPASTPQPVVKVTRPQERKRNPEAKSFAQDGCTSAAFHAKVQGGRPADIGAWPWAAALSFKEDGDYLCGGTLLADGWVMTAAHCIAETDVVYIRLGEHDLTQKEETEHRDYYPLFSIMHEDYNNVTYDNDIALIYFNNSQGYPEHVFPACLPSDYVGKNLDELSPFVVGWGTVGYRKASSNVLQEVQLTIFNNENCRQAFQPFHNVRIDSNKLCAGEEEGGKDACQGDSGGGLYLPTASVAWEVIGIVSFGFRCGNPGIPGVYTRVTEYMDWINNQMLSV
ncbi:unnamed protein product [Cyprideis torosa]|uniref:Uncharacterized protein n=1 Tax=Cyprideis torosa TaxID=163714 RepID=A0A7R8WBP1_9CRUS|nr:unnamed protein product [Cyprideis torosa]CAG0892342.1 unnamed protein product [Cyprideis torosa]